MAMSVIGLFDNPTDAQQAISDLASEGFDRSRITLTTSQSDLARFGVTPQDTDLYDSAINRGGNLVIVQTDDTDYSRIEKIFDRHDAVDIDTISTELRTASPDTTLKVLRERLNVGKREVQTGGVRIRSYVTEQPVTEQVQLRTEHVDVQRRPVDQPADPNLIDTFQERTVEVRETAEMPVVQKDARIVEEVAVNKTADQRTETVRDTVRETHVDVEPVAGGTAWTGGTDFDENYWRSDFQRRYGNSATWETYRPAYQYGYSLRSQDDFRDLDWDTAEPRLRERWEGRNPGTWDRYRDAIRSSYQYDRTAVGMDTGPGGRAYADNAPSGGVESKSQDTRGFFEKIADAITGDNVDDKTGRKVE